MQTTADAFYERMAEPERVFLIQKCGKELYLLADMEIVEGAVRTERMDFLLDSNSMLMLDIAECRARYCGGIYMDDNIGKDFDRICSEFLGICDGEDASYHIVKDDQVKNVCKSLIDGLNYVLVE